MLKTRKQIKEESAIYLQNQIGVVYGNLTIIKAGKNKSDFVEAICQCGTVKKVLFQNIKQGKTISCGCIARKNASQRLIKYNKRTRESPAITVHPLYKIWAGMLKRCYNKNDISYKRYGALGVTICKEWRNSSVAFCTWGIENGWAKGLQLDKDLKGGGQKLYSPETCCFVTRSQNCRLRKTSRFIEHNGETKTLVEWCEIYKLSHTTIIDRLKTGWSVKEALETPPRLITKTIKTKKQKKHDNRRTI